VLIVEDNSVNLMILSTFLKNKHYTFEKAKNGLQALQAVQSHPDGYFDIILMDLQMPVMGGLEATSHIRALEAQRRRQRTMQDEDDVDRNTRATILALTGLASETDRKDAFEAGVDKFLTKPVSMKDLGHEFDEWMEDTAAASLPSHEPAS